LLLGSLAEGGKPIFPFNNLVIFGDSLTDVGNIYIKEGFPFPPYFKGRYSNGPVWIEYLANTLALPTPKASLAGGFNYAYGGARSGYGISDDICCTGVFTCCTYSRGIDGHGLFSGNQTVDYLSNHKPNANTLVVIWIGANDIFAQCPIATSMANIAVQVSLLIANGAKYFLILNMPDLGIAPVYHGTPFQNIATGAALLFNAGLTTTISVLKANYSGVTFYTPDLFALSSDISFIQERGALDINHCALSLTNPNNASSPIIISSNVSIVAWWDRDHPHTNLHRAISDYISIYTFNVTNSAVNAFAFTAVFVNCVLLSLIF